MTPIRNIVFITIFVTNYCRAQSSFFIEQFNNPYINYISDIRIFQDEHFCLVIHLQPSGSNEETYSSVDIYSATGNFINSIPIPLTQFSAYQILEIQNDHIAVFGNHRTDTCSSTLKLINFNYSNETYELVSQFPICDEKYTQKALITDGLERERFIQGHYAVTGPSFYKFILEIDTSNHIKPLFDSLSVYSYLSVDFSRKGYVIKELGVCDFYTRDFQFRKQRYNILDGYEQSSSSTLLPINDHFILEHVKKPDDPPYQGQVLRVVDSLLNIKKINSISLPAPFNPEVGFMDLPFFGGLKKTEDDHYWMAGTFAFWPDWDSNYYCISKFDPELNLVCNQFLGFDAVYRLFGTTATPDGGCIVYGWRLPKGGIINSGDENYFAIKVGPNCELPTTATSNPDRPIVSISAYPNPTVNSLTFDVRGFDPTTLRVEIFNAQGITLFSRQDLSYEITVIDLPAGQYFYRIMQGGKILGVGGWVKE